MAKPIIAKLARASATPAGLVSLIFTDFQGNTTTVQMKREGLAAWLPKLSETLAATPEVLAAATGVQSSRLTTLAARRSEVEQLAKVESSSGLSYTVGVDPERQAVAIYFHQAQEATLALTLPPTDARPLRDGIARALQSIEATGPETRQ